MEVLVVAVVLLDQQEQVPEALETRRQHYQVKEITEVQGLKQELITVGVEAALELLEVMLVLMVETAELERRLQLQAHQ